MQGKTINGFELKRPLGVGGMAEVWYAENEIGMPVAVKILNDDLSRNAQIVERFRNEAMVMVKLSHQNITKVNGYGLIDGRQAIIMEYLEGNDLKSIMRSGHKFTDDELIKWWNQLISALNYTHARGVVHRDIKPSNIFIDNDGDVKLMDFGIAKIGDVGSGTQTGSTLGTRLYMSPEQVKDPKRVGPKSDNYSLAVSFVHLLTGKVPYDTTTSSDFDIQLQIVSKPLDMSGVPDNWRNFLLPYLEKDPDNRADLKSFCDKAVPLAIKTNSGEETCIDNDSDVQNAETKKTTSSMLSKTSEKYGQCDDVILNILNSANLDGSPLSAYKARNKCYEMCKAEHPYDYKEYVNLLIHERYPDLLNKCLLGEKKHKQRIAFSILLSIFIFCLFVCLWIIFIEIKCDGDILLDDYDLPVSIIFYISALIGFVSLILLFFRKKIV